MKKLSLDFEEVGLLGTVLHSYIEMLHKKLFDASKAEKNATEGINATEDYEGVPEELEASCELISIRYFKRVLELLEEKLQYYIAVNVEKAEVEAKQKEMIELKEIEE